MSLSAFASGDYRAAAAYAHAALALGPPADWNSLSGYYGDVSAYQTIQPGEYTIAMRPAGADPSTKPVISTTLSAQNGRAYTVAGLAGQSRYREIIREEAVPAALRLLKAEKPNNHDPAYQILTQVSGESFGERDYAAWERWARTARLD